MISGEARCLQAFKEYAGLEEQSGFSEEKTISKVFKEYVGQAQQKKLSDDPIQYTWEKAGNVIYGYSKFLSNYKKP